MRRWVKLLCMVAVLVVLADVSLWFVAIDRMRDVWRDFLAQTQAQGWSVAAQEPVAEGWPFAARLRAPGLELSSPDRIVPGGAAFGAEIVIAELSPLHPTRLLLFPQGRMHARVGVMADTEISVASLRAEIDLASNTTTLLADKLLFHTAPDPIPVELLNIVLHQEHDASTVQASLDGLDLSPITRQIPLDGLVRHLAATAMLYRNQLTLHDLALDWDKLGLTGNATLRADAEGQPDGEGRMMIAGAEDELSELVAVGRVTPQNAATAKLVLGLLQKRQPDGRMMVDLPLALHNRQLIVGQFPVARLPPMPPLLGMSR